MSDRPPLNTEPKFFFELALAPFETSFANFVAKLNVRATESQNAQSVSSSRNGVPYKHAPTQASLLHRTLPIHTVGMLTGIFTY